MCKVRSEKMIQKIKKNKLRSICIGLSAFLFGFITVTLFNNINICPFWVNIKSLRFKICKKGGEHETIIRNTCQQRQIWISFHIG